MLAEAILEVDLNRLPDKIQKAETAVRERLQELELRANSQEERQALSDAISTSIGFTQNPLYYIAVASCKGQS